jgi:adenylosuccinate lyase
VDSGEGSVAVNRYPHEVIDHVWSLPAKYGYWLRVEWAAARSVGSLDTARLLQNELGELDVQQILKQESVTHHDVGAFVHWMRETRGADLAHWGLSSSDLVDAGLCLAVRDVTSALLADAVELCHALTAVSLQHQATPRAARTHGVFAEPDWFGRQVGVWIDRLTQSIRQLDTAAESATQLALGGPIGRDTTHDVREIAVLLGLTVSPWRKAQARDRTALTAWVNAVASVATAVENVAIQVRLGAAHRELAEPFGPEQWGSTSMPHKHNPVRSERLCGLARVVRAQTHALAESVAWWGEHDISHSSVERIVLPLATGLTGFMLQDATRLLDGLVVNTERMSAQIEHNGTWKEWLTLTSERPSDWAEIYKELQQ